ncbi:DUF3237 family protein [Parasphingorhabdus sp.]|uniref:DUF3237 family protein n=1 Tax=Parasphingorhabdus sp. TaxID=2709688 RepID=UPI003BB08789
MAQHGFGLSIEPFMRLEIEVAQPLNASVVHGIARRCIPIIGGTVSGRYQGTILPGGADWQEIAPDGTLEISARYVLEFTEGRVEVTSNGIRYGSQAVLQKLARGEPVDPIDYYFRTAIRFRTDGEALVHLNNRLAISDGERIGSQVRLNIHEVE